MATYNDIFALNVKYIEYLLSKSLFTHQYVKNIQESGSSVESEIRSLFSKVLPSRFKVTHGYIASAQSTENAPEVSPQVDLIIVDTFVPHSLFVIDDDKGLEIVPIESVVGLFEIKRTLNRTSLLGTKKTRGALEHLNEICQSIGISKSNRDRFFPGGIMLGENMDGGFTTNPLIGIISLEYSKVLVTGKSNNTLPELITQSSSVPEFDIICSLGGLMYAISQSHESDNWTIVSIRNIGTDYNYQLKSKNKTTNHVQLIAHTFGYIVGYLQGTCGQNAPISNYYFNECLD